MKIRYRVTKVDLDGKVVCYEIEIMYNKDYSVSVYFIGTHLPNKRLTKERPLDYFMRIREDRLGINISPKLSSSYYTEIQIELTDYKKVRTLVDRARNARSVTNVRISRDQAEKLLSGFLKALYT